MDPVQDCSHLLGREDALSPDATLTPTGRAQINPPTVPWRKRLTRQDHATIVMVLWSITGLAYCRTLWARFVVK